MEWADSSTIATIEAERVSNIFIGPTGDAAAAKRITGDEVRVNFNSRGFFSFSDNGILVYDQSTEGESRQLTWLSQAQERAATVGRPSFIDA